MTHKAGTITSWKNKKAFGFITPETGGKPVFFHINDFSKKHQRPKQGLPVSYNLSHDKRNRICAVHVTPGSGHKQNQRNHKKWLFSGIIPIVFFIMAGVSALLGKIPVIIPVIYIITSMITYALYSKDKAAAQNGTWRTPENTLQLLSLIGGWPGAFIAQKRLRHKTKKISFKIVYWMTVLINCGVLYWFFTSEGSLYLNQFIRKI